MKTLQQAIRERNTREETSQLLDYISTPAFQLFAPRTAEPVAEYIPRHAYLPRHAA